MTKRMDRVLWRIRSVGHDRPAMAALVVVTVALAGCSSGDWEATTYQRGDTTVVRTIAGSEWGSPAMLVEEARLEESDSTFRAGIAALTVDDDDVYVIDADPGRLYVFDRDGELRGSVRSTPEDETDYTLPNGVVVLPDGRIVVRDPIRSQMVVYSERGEYLERWPHPAGVYSPLPLLLDEEGGIYTRVVFNPEASREDWVEGLVRYSLDGEISDTIPDPTFDYVPPFLVAADASGDTARLAIPFYPRTHWARSKTGEIVRAVSDTYAIEVMRPDGSVLRIEKDYSPVAISREESLAHQRALSRKARQIDYRWTWRGPVIPDHKPPFKGIFTDHEGRIWVHLHQPAELRREAATDPSEQARSDDWVEPDVFDVFETDGRYLGSVSFPPDVRLTPQPVIEGNTVWAVVAAEGTKPTAVRFRLDR